MVRSQPVGPSETEFIELRQLAAKFNFYKLVISIIGLLVICQALAKELLRPPSTNDMLILIVFFVLILMAELWPIASPNKTSEIDTEFSMTTPIVVSAFLSYGPSRSMIVTFASLFCAGIWSQYKQPYRPSVRWLLEMSTFNSSIYIISVAAASIAFIACGGKTLAQGDSISMYNLVWPLLCWVATWTTVDMLLFATGVSLALQEPWIVHARQSLIWYIPNYVIIGPSGILFAMLYSERGIYGILLVIIPFLVGRQAMNQHAIQLDTYRETITTLGSYMQHYHPYTKGHLERVANLAEQIAREMRLPPQSLTHIHKAGLLHDIGKVGVD